MKIIVGVGHPKHVHFFKNIINNLIEKGHDLKIVAWDKDITFYLLDKYNFNYDVIGPNYKGLSRKAYGLIKNDTKLYIIAKKFNPDIFVSGSPYLAHISKLMGKYHIGFTDTESAKLTNLLFFPFSDVIITPSAYKGDINPKKHIPYNGFEELAYLHPRYFKPDISILSRLGLHPDEKYIVVRFVAWEASHDTGEEGFIDKTKIIKTLEQRARVFITSEKKLPESLEKYKIVIPPEKMHDLLYYADLFIGESASMACESSMLGTPSIFVSTTRRGYTDELESRYDMLYNFSDPVSGQENALNKAVELLDTQDIKIKWQLKRNELLNEKIDVTKFLTELIGEYPQSFKNLKVGNVEKSVNS